MCASCGCGRVDDPMGDGRHITMSDLKSAATAARISVFDVAKNIQWAAGLAARTQRPAARDSRRTPGQPLGTR
jgi:hypothetical protein